MKLIDSAVLLTESWNLQFQNRMIKVRDKQWGWMMGFIDEWLDLKHFKVFRDEI